MILVVQSIDRFIPMASPVSFILLPVTFIREVIAELKQVTWPTRQEAARSTLIVIVFSIIVGLYIAVLDLGFTKGIEAVLSLNR